MQKKYYNILNVLVSTLIISPVFFSLTNNFDIVTNRIHNYFIIDEQPIINNFYLSLPLNFFILSLISLFYLKKIITSKVIVLFSFFIIIIIIFNYNYFFFYLKNSFSILVVLISGITFKYYFSANNSANANNVIIIPFFILLCGLIPNFFLNILLLNGDVVFFYFFPNLIIYNFFQYFAFIFLIFCSFSFKNKFLIFFFNIVTLIIAYYSQNQSVIIILVLFNLYKFINFFLNSNLKIIFLNFKTYLLIVFIFFWITILYSVPFDILPLSIKDRYTFIFDFFAHFNFLQLILPIGNTYEPIKYGLHNQFLELTSKFGILISTGFYLIIFKKIFLIKFKQSNVYLMYLLILSLGCSLSSVFLHPYTSIIFLYYLTFIINKNLTLK